MATVLISAAVNIGIGLALNALFPLPDQEQEGPRLSELGFTSAAYGRFVNIPFGTDRIPGNIIDTPAPAIEEVVTDESTRVGKGGGQRVNSRTYTYFLTADVSFSINGATALIRVWADGKLIYDIGSTDQVVREGIDLLFYPGGATQEVDPEEEARRGVGQVPAYRHLTRVKLNRMPLADFGNRIPNFTAEVAFNSQAVVPFLGMDEPAGLDVPGSLAGSIDNYMLLDPARNIFYSLKNSATGLWAADATNMQFRTVIGGGAFTQPTVGVDGFAYTQIGSSNSVPVFKKDVDTGLTVGQAGNDSTSLGDTLINFGNFGTWHQLSVTTPSLGVHSLLLHMNPFTNTGVVLNADEMVAFKTLDTSEILSMDGFTIPDHDRGRFYSFVASGGVLQLTKIEFQFTSGVGGIADVKATVTELRQFTRGDPGDDFEDAADPMGWAVDRGTGHLILSNGVNMVLYDPEDDLILASRQDLGFESRNNYFNSGLMAFSNTTSVAGSIFVIDTHTLVTRALIDTDTIPWQGGDPVINDASTVWDERTQSLLLSRVDSGSLAVDPNRILRVALNRVSGLGVTLDTIVLALSTSYNDLEMAGLAALDVDVAPLAVDTVLGYTINRRSTIRSALEPLRKHFFFDGVQSDWIMKFVKRGGSSVLTIPQQDVGQLQRGEAAVTSPAVKEMRTQDIELPMRVSVRYRNRNADYSTDVEYDKRLRAPNPVVNSKSEQTIDIPIVSIPLDIKRTASKWLHTLWTERRRLNTVVPWTYLELDPTDVFDMVVFEETFRLRLLEQDVGAGFAMDLTGAVEDVKNLTSTLGAGSALGHVSSLVPSSLPMGLVFLDAPLLSMQDLSTVTSAAYVAVTAFADGWPGGSVYRGVDNASQVPVGLANVESATAKILVAPGTWPRDRNRFQESSEGGTITLTPLRRTDVWASAPSEVAVLNGANVVAVVTPGGVEVMQFQSIVVSPDNTVVLSRLLRGRLGTEIRSETAVPVGSSVVLLADEAGVRESGPIIRQDMALSDLNKILLYRGVTVGTLLENAVSRSFTYTGRDLKPYFVTAIVNVLNVDDSVTITWIRRTRGPGIGEWLDGTGTVPLNETIRSYDVEIERDSDNVVVFSQTVGTEQCDLTTSEASSILFPAGNLLTNGDAETGALTPWVQEVGSTWQIKTLPYLLLTTPDPSFPAGSSRVIADDLGGSSIEILRQEIDLSTVLVGFADVDAGLVTTDMKTSIGQPRTGITDRCACRTAIEFLDGVGSPISKFTDVDWHSPTANNWKRTQLATSVPPLTRKIQYELHVWRGSFTSARDENENLVLINATSTVGAFDNVVALITDPFVAHTVRVFQNSEQVGRGDPAMRPLTF